MNHNIKINVTKTEIIVNLELKVRAHKEDPFKVENIRSWFVSVENKNEYGRQNLFFINYHANGKDNNLNDRTESLRSEYIQSRHDYKWVDKSVFVVILNEDVKTIADNVCKSFIKVIEEFRNPCEFYNLLHEISPELNPLPERFIGLRDIKKEVSVIPQRPKQVEGDIVGFTIG